MISKFALILLIFNNILIQSISNLHVWYEWINAIVNWIILITNIAIYTSLIIYIPLASLWRSGLNKQHNGRISVIIRIIHASLLMIENESTQLTVFHCLCPLPASRKGLCLPLRSALFGEGGIWFYIVCKGEIDLQTKEHNIFWKL